MNIADILILLVVIALVLIAAAILVKNKKTENAAADVTVPGAFGAVKRKNPKNFEEYW